MTNRRTRHSVRALGAVATGLGCGLVAIGLVGAPGVPSWTGGGPLRPASQAGPTGLNAPAGLPGDPFQVPATAATWVAADGSAEQDGRLRAGDHGGGAVGYLKFELSREAPPPASPPDPPAVLRLTRAEDPLPELVELVAVPDTSWEPEQLSWQNAPVLGSVLQSVRPAPDASAVTFEVAGAVAGPGVYAFAVTVPPDRGAAAFVGADGSPEQPVLQLPRSPAPRSPTVSPTAGPPAPRSPTVSPTAGPPAPPSPTGSQPVPSPPPEAYPAASGSPAPVEPPECTLGELLVPTCGVLWGAAPSGHTGEPRTAALAEFEATTGRRQDIYHAYHRGTNLFPTAEEAAIAAEGRILFLNWKPLRWSWSQVASGHPAADAYLDRLAEHINRTFPEPFFFTIHHEPENDVRPWPGSGFQATDYAAMYRHVVERLRASGVDNLVTVMSYMAYVPWNIRPWFPDLYPGDDAVDWVAWDTYAYSDPGYGHGDFAEMMNRRSMLYPDWPGFYTWATGQFPDKPFMLGEWGVWHSRRNPGHMAELYESVSRQTPLFPRMKAMVYFDTPADQRARDSRPERTEAGLAAYRRLGAARFFQVQLGGRADPAPPGYGR